MGAPAMIYEHRTYTVAHGLMDEYLLRYETHALPLQQKHLGRLVGFFVTDIGPLNQVIHIWAYDSFEHRAAVRGEAAAKGIWPPEPNLSDFYRRRDSILCRPAPFSPLG